MTFQWLKWSKIKKFWNILWKIVLLGIGFVSFFDLMPQAYGIYDDILTAYVFMIFWLEFGMNKIMFGSPNKKLDKITIATFYVLILNTFVRWFQILDITDPVIIKTYEFIANYTPYWLSNATKTTVLFVHNEANTQLFSMISAYFGFTILALIILYITFKVKFNDKSLVYCLSSFFMKRETWDKYFFLKNVNKIKYYGIRFLLVLLTILGIYQYLFLLITQWFLITMGKTLLIFAILYAIKDINKSSIKAFNTMGQFDDVFLGWFTDFLTDKRKVYLSIALLLILHYLSDISTFFIPFFMGVEVNEFFVSLMGIESYKPLMHLISIDSVYGIVEAWWVYILSTIGILILIILPMVILFLTIMKVNLKKMLENRPMQVIYDVLLVGIIVYLFAPWVKQLVIKNTGIQGVNFVTQLISTNSMFTIQYLFFWSFIVMALLTLLLILLRKTVFAKYLFIISYLISLAYLGEYIWNYFQSSFVYHSNIIMNSGQIFLSIIFSMLLIVEFLFYIGGFVLLSYKFSRYIVSHIINELITGVNIVIWTFIFLLTPVILMYNLNIYTLTLAFIAILVLFIFSYALSKELKGEEYRDDYLLGVSIIIMTYQITLMIISILTKMYNLDEGLINFIQPVIVFFLSVLVLLFFKTRVDLKETNPKKITLALIVGIFFGIIFYFVNEPISTLPNQAFTVILVFTLFVSLSEEILFRGVLLRLAQKAFSYTKAIFLQAFVFAGVHFMSFKYILQHYSENKSIFLSSVPLLMNLYFVLLVVFGIVAGYLAEGTQERKSRIIYPIVMHWVANLIVFFVLFYT